MSGKTLDPDTMEIPLPPSPPHFLLALGWAIGIGLSFIAISGGANKAAHLSIGLRAKVSKLMAYATLGVGAALVGLIGLALAYPHHHHDVQWFNAGRSVNYAVDAVIGVSAWFAAWLIYRLGWRRSARGNPT